MLLNYSLRPCLFFNAPAPTAVSTLSLHDALPISLNRSVTDTITITSPDELLSNIEYNDISCNGNADGSATINPRSEEHTSELQSRPHLVCRLLLEKKNQTAPRAAPSRAARIRTAD